MSDELTAWSGKVGAAFARSPLLLEIAPRVTELPAPIQKYDDPFLPYCRAVFAATGDYVAGYVLDLAAFLALGAAGAVALERAAAILAMTPDTLSILEGPFARAEYAALAGERALRVDAATVTDAAVAASFRLQGVVGLVCTAAGPGAADSLCLDTGTAWLAGRPFRVVRQSFPDRFKREDFAEALQRAIAAERTGR